LDEALIELELAMKLNFPGRVHLVILCATGALVMQTAAVNAQTVCIQADPDFTVMKSPDKYDILYKNSQVYRVEPDRLKDLFGHAVPTTTCDADIGSKDVIGLVVGWKLDLLLAFGIMRDINGSPIRLNRLSWTPHSTQFDPIKIDGQDILAHYGNSWTRICWNRGGSQTWTFSTDIAPPSPDSCSSTRGPKGSDQYLVSVPN
jgi:hypothetical protein